MMAKTARTRNTKEIICPAEGSVDFDPVLKVARCSSCGQRVTRLPNGELMRHVPPPLLVNQVWSVAEGRYVG